jgi:hypothetical protein
MILSRLIKKGGLTSTMTATVATPATDTPHSPATVAPVATVAVAEHPIPALSSNEEAMIRTWLAHIRETDLAQINQLLEKCRTNLKTRQYVLEQARTRNLSIFPRNIYLSRNITPVVWTD